MTQSLLRLCITIVVMGFSLMVYAQDHTAKAYWKEGFRMESADKSYKVKLGGRIQYDMMMMNQSDTLNAHFTAANGAELRRARLYASGSIYSNINFKLQLDFSNNQAVVKDAYMDLTKLPYVGNLRVGYFKEPFGLNTLNSSNNITFLERPIPNDLDFDRNFGLMLFNQHFDQKFSWAAGFFIPKGNTSSYQGDETHLTARVVGVPIYKDDENYTALHIAAAFSGQFNDNQSIKISTKPEAHLAPKYIKLEIDKLRKSNSTNIELAYVLNQFSLQGEYHLFSFFPSDSGLTQKQYNLNSYYISLSYFLTGEHKNYSKKSTHFEGVSPNKNFGQDGWGAFEIAARYSHSSYDDHDINGGMLNDVTLGMNWYLNPAVRLMFNYVYSDVPQYGGHANIYQMRFQVAF